MSHARRSRLIGLSAALVALTLVPTPMLAADTESESKDGPVAIARSHVADNAASLGVRSADVSDLRVASSYRSAHNGVTHVNMNQRFDGLEVFGAYVTVNVASDGEVLFVGDSLVDDLADASGRVATDATEAVEAAAGALDLDDPANLRVISESDGPAQRTVVSGGGVSNEPIPARLGWQPTKGGLRLAWQLVIDDTSADHLWNATVDAANGKLLAKDDWVDHDTMKGLASGLARPSVLAQGISGAQPPSPVEDGSSYRVYELPKESPNDGDRTLVTNPAEGTASPFGWHDTDGDIDPDFTVTRGNNVHAYTDHNASNDLDESIPVVIVDPPSSAAGQYSSVRASFGPNIPDGGIAGSIELADDGVEVVTDGCEPFTVTAGAIALVDRGACNFTVKVKNAQVGGAAAAIVANNVGGAPFAMGGTDPTIMIPSVMISLDDGNTIKAGLPATGSLTRIPGANPPEPEGGPGLTFDFPIDLATEHPHDYWDAAVTNLFFWNNTIHDVLYGYGFDEASGNFQVTNYSGLGAGGDDVRAEAQDGGGINNANFATPAMDGGRPRMQMFLWNLGDPFRDGDLENGVIVHEYVHGLSNRLTGGPTINCLSGNEQMGEGWSDWYANAVMIDPALDDPDGPRGMGTYVLYQDSRQGNGIRPRPYSRDMNIQPFTYDRIKTNSWITGGSLAIPHGIGHGWASVLWDMTWNLIDARGFNPNVYENWSTGGNNLALQLVTDGLKFQGCGPGFVAGRDAIIGADNALTGGENACILWSSFARRGLGFSAIQGTTNRDDNTEAFDVPPTCAAPGTGFAPPVSNPPAVNTFVAGETVPLRFNIGGNRGADPLASNSPSSQAIDCATGLPLQFAVTTPTDSANDKLTYNAAQQRYQYLWETLPEWAGTCRQVIITLDDGTQLRARFEFTA
jgi:extracellular elastinolytic metalloproteinase